MAGGDYLIESISPKSFKQVKAFDVELTKVVGTMGILINTAKKIKLPSELKGFSKKTQTNIEQANKLVEKSIKLYEKQRLADLKLDRDREKAFDKYTARLNKEKAQREAQVNKESQLRQRLLAQRKKEEKAAARAVALSEKEALAVAKAAQVSKELGRALNVATRKRNALAKIITDLNVKRNLGTKLTAKEVALLKRSERAFQRYNNAVNRANHGVGRFQNNVGNYPQAMRGAISAARSLASALGLVGGAFLIVQVARNAIGVIRDYEKANATLSAVLQQTTEQTTALREDSKRLGATTVKSANEVTQLQIAYARLGFSQQQIIDLTESTIQGSIAMNSELSATAELAGAIVNTFDDFSTTDAPRILDIMALATAKSALNFSKLETGLPIVAGAANAAGVPFTKLVALMGKLADSGIDVSSSSTAIRNIFIESAAQGLNYEQILKKIKGSTDKLTASNDEFGKRAAVSASVLANNIDKTHELDDALQGASGTAKEMADKELATLDGALKLLKSAWDGVILGTDEANGLSEKMAKTVRFLADNLDTMFSVIGSLIKAWITYKIVMVASSLATTIYTGAVTALRIAKIALARGIGSATKAMGLFNAVSKLNVIGALSTALAVAVGLWVGFRDGVNDSVEALKDLTKEAKEANKAIIENDIALIESQINRIDAEEKNQKNASKKKIELIDNEIESIKNGTKDLYADTNEIIKKGEEDEREEVAKSYEEKINMLMNNEQEVKSIMLNAAKQGQKIRLATQKDTEKLINNKKLTLAEKNRENRLDNLKKIRDKILTQQKKLTESENENSDAKGKNNKAIEGSVKWYQAEISKLKELRDSKNLTKEQYKQETEAIKKLQKELNLLIGKQEKQIKTEKELSKLNSSDYFDEKISALTKERAAVASTAKEYALYTQLIKNLEDAKKALTGANKDEAKSQEDLIEVLKQYKDEVKDYLSGFADDIAAPLTKSLSIFFDQVKYVNEQGEDVVSSTFEKMLANADSFSEKFAVSFNSIAEAAQQTFSMIDQFSQASFEKRKTELAQEKEIALLFAGENADAREQIETQYNERIKQLENKRNKQKKDAALFNIGVDTAQGIVSTIAKVGFPGAIPLIALIAAIGVAQAAMVASTDVPQFKDGVENFGGGLAILGDGGKKEVVTDKRGRFLGVSRDKDTLYKLPKGANVYKDEETYFQKAVGSGLMSHSAYAPAIQRQSDAAQARQNINIAYNGITKNEMRQIMSESIAKQPKHISLIDKNGFSAYAQKELIKTNYRNNFLKL